MRREQILRECDNALNFMSNNNAKSKQCLAHYSFPSEHWTQGFSHLNLMLSSLSYRDMHYLEDLKSQHRHGLLVLTKLSPRFKWSRNKRQFKGMPSSMWLTSSGRWALDLNDWGPGSVLTGVTLFFISHSKASDANIFIIANSVCL